MRPKFPEKWHVPNNPKLWITWKHAKNKLATEKVYWISTASRQGRPHAAPVWGIWRENRLYFETDPNSTKGKNLSSNSRLVAHVQDGMDTVILEGRAIKEMGDEVLSQLRRQYKRKYRYTPNWSNEQQQVVFRVEPKVVHAWKAPKMHRSLVKFVF